MNLLETKEELILCGYKNKSPQIQVIRVTHLSSYQLEKVIFPKEYWLFYAPKAGKLEIYANFAQKEILVNQIPCHQLQVRENYSH